jgi:nicotinamide mononucleotide adenylyltransferase
MSKVVAKSDKVTSSTKKRYSLFVGRWQPWHKGHEWLIGERLKKGKNVLICVRNVKVDHQNPFSPRLIKKQLEKKFAKMIALGRIRVMIMPDIESINYGRGVGYDVIEHRPPKHIGNVSATKIREKMRKKPARQ